MLNDKIEKKIYLKKYQKKNLSQLKLTLLTSHLQYEIGIKI